MSEIEKLNMIAEWQEQYKQLIEDLDNSKKRIEELEAQLTKAKELLKWFVWYFREGSPNLVPYKHKVAEAEQFLNDLEK